MSSFDDYEFAKTPAYRSDQSRTSYSWLKGKVIDDNLSDPKLWRVDDTLYDLSGFADQHPGGKDWITATQGQDITEAFHCSHVNIEKAYKYLKPFAKGPAKGKRNSPFVFEEKGFYCTLRGRVYDVLSKAKVADCTGENKSGGSISGSTRRLEQIMDGLFFGWLLLAALALYLQNTTVALLAGFVLSLVGTCAHNYFHQRDNWRMYTFDCLLLSSYDWRISHAMSHHLFPNTSLDLEVYGLEPFLLFLPKKKNIVYRALSKILIFLVETIALPIEYLKRHIGLVQRPSEMRWEYTLVWIQLAVCWYYNSLSLWMYMHMSCSFWFALIGLTAAHHSPEIWHSGDEAMYTEPAQKKTKGFDWGLFQLDAVRDRKEVEGSLFLRAVWFGSHALHHMFPTIDQAKLTLLVPVFEQTMAEFNVDWPISTSWNLAKGKYIQLNREKNHDKVLRQKMSGVATK